MEFQGFPRIHSIFYLDFHDQNGTTVKCQVPEGSITPLENPKGINVHYRKPLINYKAISKYITPKEGLSKQLIIIKTDGYKVMGYPFWKHDPVKYRKIRNEIRSNLCFVFEQDAETSSYEAVIRKLSRVLEGLENECNFLSDKKDSKFQLIQNVIEQLFEDLNSYCECQIPIDTLNTVINLKLFPTYSNPPTVYDYHVPVFTVDISKMMDSSWDITVQKVASLIDGVRHVKRIAELADVKLEWARESLEHMMYYGSIILLDIFQYSNIYAVKPEIMQLFDPTQELAQECLNYIRLPNTPEIPIERVYAIYCGLKYGKTVKDWVKEQELRLLQVDERRVISFGIIKGLIYRIHKYPVLTYTMNDNENQLLASLSNEQVIKNYTGTDIHPDILPFLNGKHHYDEICTALECSPHELDEQLSSTQPDEKAMNQQDDDQVVETAYEGVAEEKQNADGLPQWTVQFIYR